MKREFNFGKKFFLVAFSLLVFAALLAYVAAVGFRVNDNMFFISPTDGKVGIGTNTPTQKLDVAGKVKATEFCLGTNCITTWPTGTSNTNPSSSQWTTSGSNIYYNAGKVGIGTGTSAPPYLLSLGGSGAVLSIDRTGQEPAIRLVQDGSDANGAQIRGVQGGGLKVTNAAATTEWFRVDGDVRIGRRNDNTPIYLQLDYLPNEPPATDCDSDAEIGRTIFAKAENNYRLYICKGASGWGNLGYGM